MAIKMRSRIMNVADAKSELSLLKFVPRCNVKLEQTLLLSVKTKRTKNSVLREDYTLPNVYNTSSNHFTHCKINRIM